MEDVHDRDDLLAQCFWQGQLAGQLINEFDFLRLDHPVGANQLNGHSERRFTLHLIQAGNGLGDQGFTALLSPKLEQFVKEPSHGGLIHGHIGGSKLQLNPQASGLIAAQHTITGNSSEANCGEGLFGCHRIGRTGPYFSPSALEWQPESNGEQSMPSQALVVLCCGVVGLLLVVINALLIPSDVGSALPVFQRSSVLAGVMAVGLMLVSVLWTRANPIGRERVSLEGPQGFELKDNLPEALRLELAWASHQLLKATPAASVLLIWDETELLRRGVLSTKPFVSGPIVQRAQQQQQTVALVNLTLYPGRNEFSYFPEKIPAVVVEPLGQRGWLLVAGWSVRCFSRSDELWMTGLAEKLKTELEAHWNPETV